MGSSVGVALFGALFISLLNDLLAGGAPDGLTPEAIAQLPASQRTATAGASPEPDRIPPPRWVSASPARLGSRNHAAVTRGLAFRERRPTDAAPRRPRLSEALAFSLLPQ